ncbi:MAG TPA: hypothetical protein VNO70_27945 [Blastocatellia bacterium]|nr:hypothetical protein [Blastocatellia bacterium]
MPVWYAQEHPTSCVAACVRMVLSDLGEDWTEGHVRGILGRPRLGITLKSARERLVHAGVRAFLHEDWSLYDLRDALSQGMYPIVGVERHPLGYAPASHAIVVVRIASKQIRALDPLNGPQAR